MRTRRLRGRPPGLDFGHTERLDAVTMWGEGAETFVDEVNSP